MMKKTRLPGIGVDLLKVLILATFSSCLSLGFNQLRNNPLPLIYVSKQERMDQAVDKLASESTAASVTANSKENPPAPEIVSLSEFKMLVDAGKELILDARPDIFYRLGHVPGALSLPRDDFENGYANLGDKLSDKNKLLVIYCSSSSCEDSDLVKNALMQLGYTNISIFKEGWAAWESAGYPQVSEM